MRKTVFILILFGWLSTVIAYAQQSASGPRTVREVMEELKREHDVNFVYDSSIRLDVPYSGPSLKGKSLKSNLNNLFNRVGLKWERKGKYVVIFPRRDFTVSGYVVQEDGETVINATVQDLRSGAGTMTNEHGFYSLTLPEGQHSLRYSFIGYTEKVADVKLTSDQTRNVTLHPGEELEEVVVTADLNSPLHTTQTGKISLTGKDLDRGYALLSSPDVVKTLQTLSGVAAGTDVTSGLYVHGGSHDQNLFMLDGTPLYQVNHLGGLFSSFNTDVVKNIDFYKSGFPARYGGRLSSVVDVRTRDGNMSEYHGSFSIGLLDGRLQFEGPIVKNRTSFNIGLRRTWLDLIAAPLQRLSNHSSDDKTYLRSAFHDFNAKVTHIFSERSRADLNVYSGDDLLKATDDMHTISVYPNPGELVLREYAKMDFHWGNFTAALNWKYQFSPKLYAVFTGLYTYNRSKNSYYENDTEYEHGEETFCTHTENKNRSTIHDMGYRMEFDYRPGRMHHLRMGSNYLMHFFKPQNYNSLNYSGDTIVSDTLRRSLSDSFHGHEMSVYIEDDIAFGENLRLNAGVHFTLFNIPGHTYNSLEPRLALRYQCNDWLTLKASYTKMSQFMHQMSNTYLNLPMDYWVPSTKNIPPSRSHQYAAGAYLMLPRNLRFSLEGYYKTMSDLMEYDGGSSLTPPYQNWEENMCRGRGRAYGIEVGASYGNERIGINAAYTLSWSERNFPDFYNGWFPDKFDNRHKFNVNFSWKLSKGIDIYAGWLYHSGNRMTVAQQIVIGPIIPGVGDHYTTQWLYDKPNNLSMPGYHRLDLGINFRKVGKSGRERIWNISLYNAYCQMNPFCVRIKQNEDGTFRGQATAITPIIPSISYTLKF
ncbi:TonB-dependent receptor [uncultured Duncaniella sp.]|uniref:TonB-dependent receptor domain-containing protein n=2 Tax=uncultured Duncaniella sp. TaxID=2768039 RepID=UPI0026373F52|nr:TonB-dependent receptor [uncultured Duncaniella sp.]